MKTTQQLASVASIFVSRWDVAVKDKVLDKLRNRLGIAIAKCTYKAHRDLLASVLHKNPLAADLTSLRDGKVTRVPAEQLVPGDIVHLEQGDNIPADCRLIEAFGARVNNAAVTGESLPKARQADPSDVDGGGRYCALESGAGWIQPLYRVPPINTF